MPEIFEILRVLKVGSGGEIQLADAINIQAKKGLMETVRLNGKRFDCGLVKGFIGAVNNEYASRCLVRDLD
jgi:UTP--glucose-1-phosphate uridylyltransferase